MKWKRNEGNEGREIRAHGSQVGKHVLYSQELGP